MSYHAFRVRYFLHCPEEVSKRKIDFERECCNPAVGVFGTYSAVSLSKTLDTPHLSEKKKKKKKKKKLVGNFIATQTYKYLYHTF